MPAVAIITGAARGIGAAIAEQLAGDGVQVCVTDVDGDEAAATAERLRADGHVATAATMDVADPGSCAAIAQLVAEDLGPPTILVNNAGITRSGFLHKMSDADWDLVQDINLRGSFNAARAVAPWFRRGEDSSRRVVNTSSIAGVHGGTAGANYVSAKAGVIGLTKALASEWAPFRVTVNAIAPGLIQTRMLSEAMPDHVRDAMTRRVPLGRMGRPEDIAAAVGFLCSPGAGYITGQTLEIHGGFTELTPADQPVS